MTKPKTPEERMRMGRPRSPNACTDPLLNVLLAAAEASGLPDKDICKLAGVHRLFLSYLRTGFSKTAFLSHAVWIADALGYEIIIRKKGPRYDAS